MSGSGCQLKKSQAFPSAVAALCVRLMAKCMPAQALAPMWQALKHGQSWMGLVKNRCKNSDHFSGISERAQFYWEMHFKCRSEPARDEARADAKESGSSHAQRDKRIRLRRLRHHLSPGRQHLPGNIIARQMKHPLTRRSLQRLRCHLINHRRKRIHIR